MRLGYGNIGKSALVIENFISTLLGIAKETIPKTIKQVYKSSTPRFNVSCGRAVAEQKNVRTFTNNPTNLNLKKLAHLFWQKLSELLTKFSAILVWSHRHSNP